MKQLLHEEVIGRSSDFVYQLKQKLDFMKELGKDIAYAMKCLMKLAFVVVLFRWV